MQKNYGILGTLPRVMWMQVVKECSCYNGTSRKKGVPITFDIKQFQKENLNIIEDLLGSQ